MRQSKFSAIRLAPMGLLISLFALILTPAAQAQSKIQLFGGFSYVHSDVRSVEAATLCAGCTPIFVRQHPNAYGWEFSGAYKLVPFVSAKVEFGEQYGKVNGGNVRLKTYLFGPQLSLPGPVSPFLHAEFGFAHQSIGAYTGAVLASPGTDTSFATALGGGLDIPAVPFFAIRLIQIDYLRTSLYHQTQHEPRVSAGIVLHF